MVWRRNVLLQLNPDHHRAVDLWYFGPDPQIWTTTTGSRSSLCCRSVIFRDILVWIRIWICIRIRLRIRDILVRIRIRRSEPLHGSRSSFCCRSVIFRDILVRICRSEPLQLNPDHHCAVDPWYFGPDPQIRTTDLRIWICIRIRLQIRDILVRIRIRRSEPLQLDPDHHCAVDPWYSVIFWSGSADPNHYNWIQIIIVL